MGHTLKSFAAKSHEILTAENNPKGRAKVAVLLQEALRDPEFVAQQFDDNTPERKILYEDPEIGFCILAHQYRGAKESAPHDHGPSWAIYGQAGGETTMSDWTLLEPASPEKAGKVKKKREYKLTPGIAHVYNEGDLHSPSRNGPTRLIRIEGTNMEKVNRLKFEAVADKVTG
jgi:predicted metal-dependent enzyme (double-stranded beta helix superfamily)